MYSVTARNVEQVEEIQNKFGYASASECVRHAIRELHRKLEPAYLKPSVREELKKKEMTEKEEFEQLTDLEYVSINLPGSLTVTADTNVEFVLIHAFANSVKALPFIGIKDRLVNDPLTVKIHNDAIKNKTMAEALSPYIQTQLFDEFAITIPAELLEEKVV